MTTIRNRIRVLVLPSGLAYKLLLGMELQLPLEMGLGLPLGNKSLVTTCVGDRVGFMVTVNHIGRAAIRNRTRVTVRDKFRVWVTIRLRV